MRVPWKHKRTLNREGPLSYSSWQDLATLTHSLDRVKVIYEKESKQVLGFHIIGPEASDLIGEAAHAIEMGSTVEDISLTVHPHPTLTESVMEAAKAALGEAIHIVNR